MKTPSKLFHVSCVLGVILGIALTQLPQFGFLDNSPVAVVGLLGIIGGIAAAYAMIALFHHIESKAERSK